MNTVLSMPIDRGWHRALMTLGLALGVLLWLYRDTMLGMVEIWSRSETFTHAFTVAPISLWLIWRRRALLAQVVPRPLPWLLLPMASAVLAWLLGSLASVNVLMQFALVALLVMCVPALLGWQVARTIRFPLLFLFFCVPIGEFMMPRLMEWTADFTVWALHLSGIPVLREGLQFSIPSGRWSVEAACSGIRYLIASVMVGVLFAYLNYRSPLRRGMFVAVSVLVPIIANWLRAYLIVLIGHLSDNRLAVGVDHLIYGWLFFGIVIMLMLAIGMRWAQHPAPQAVPPAGARRPAPHPSATVATAAALVALVALPTVLLARLEADGARAPQLSLGRALMPEAGWTTVAQAAADWQNGFRNPTAQLQRNFAKDGQQVGVQLAYYASEAPDSKLVSSTNTLVAAQRGDWIPVTTGSHAVQLPDTQTLWRTTELRPAALAPSEAGKRLVVWQIFWVNGRLTSSNAWAKLQMVLDRLGSGRGDGVAILLYAAQDKPGQAAATLESFARDNVGALAARLGQSRFSGGNPL